MSRRKSTKVPFPFQKALVMAELGVPYRQIAETMGTPYGTVCARVFRARERLAEYGPDALKVEDET